MYGKDKNKSGKFLFNYNFNYLKQWWFRKEQFWVYAAFWLHMVHYGDPKIDQNIPQDFVLEIVRSIHEKTETKTVGKGGDRE